MGWMIGMIAMLVMMFGGSMFGMGWLGW